MHRQRHELLSSKETGACVHFLAQRMAKVPSA
jgi:hypothetical protein